jgi:23S rRNA (adenine2503-C2)-methyltransferase
MVCATAASAENHKEMQIPGPIDPVPVPRAPATGGDTRPDLVGLTRDAIREKLAKAGLDPKQAKLRAKQIWHQIYNRGAVDFEAMSDIARPQRAWLAERFIVGRPEIALEQVSVDGTRKWLLRTRDGHDFEMVFIPDADRGTLCVSSQIGCTLNCRFCHTGTMRLVRNLDPGEIVGQVMLARDALGEWPAPAAEQQSKGAAEPQSKGAAEQQSKGAADQQSNAAAEQQSNAAAEQQLNRAPEGRMLSNIVMMGMGEPLYNFDNVRDALKIVMDGDGLGLSRRRITLSTSGVVPMMARAGAEIGVNLAVSLHAVTKEVRDEIVPLNRKYGIEELLAACAAYPGANNARRITFEYVMLKGKNDSDEDARELVRLLRKHKLPAKVNLIPFNPWPGSAYECSDEDRIRRFSDIVFEAGISAPIRRPRGRDIMAACGQLKSAAEKKSRAELDRIADEKQAALA